MTTSKIRKKRRIEKYKRKARWFFNSCKHRMSKDPIAKQERDVRLNHHKVKGTPLPKEKTRLLEELIDIESLFKKEEK